MTNPNGSNQHTSDPREQKCWDLYVESLSKGMPNAHESAINAGYEESSAKNITLRGWFKERLQGLERKEMLSKAEKVLAKTLSYKTEDEEGRVKVDLLRVQLDASKHITSTLGKNDGYSTRNEVTGKDGVPIRESIVSEEIRNLAKSLNELSRSNNRTSEPGNGTYSDTVDKEIRD